MSRVAGHFPQERFADSSSDAVSTDADEIDAEEKFITVRVSVESLLTRHNADFSMRYRVIWIIVWIYIVLPIIILIYYKIWCIIDSADHQNAAFI